VQAQQLCPEARGGCGVKRRFQGLASTAQADADVRDGVFLVRLDHVRYSRERQKPFYTVRFSVLDPEVLVRHTFSVIDCDRDPGHLRRCTLEASEACRKRE